MENDIVFGYYLLIQKCATEGKRVIEPALLVCRLVYLLSLTVIVNGTNVYSFLHMPDFQLVRIHNKHF
jgi:hypothetical protein